MSSLPLNFSYEMISEPLDEDEVRFYQTLVDWCAGEYVRIKVCVKHELCGTLPQQPSVVVLPNSYLYQQTVFAPMPVFLQNGLTFMQINVPSSAIPSQLMCDMMPDLMAYVANVRNFSSSHRFQRNRMCIYPIVLNICIQMLVGEYDNGHITNTNVSDGEDEDDEPEFVPASEDAIASLEKVVLEDGTTNEVCTICQIMLDPQSEVTRMPCRHVYHQECIVQWLRTSHMCPICRYPMSTSTSG